MFIRSEWRFYFYFYFIFLFSLLLVLVLMNVVSFFFSLTQATDTGNIRLVFAAVKETILQNALKDSGIL